MYQYPWLANALGLKNQSPTQMDLIKIARKGIPRESVDSLANTLKLTLTEMTKYLHVSVRTLKRYEPKKRLTPNLSDYVLQMAKVYSRSVEVFDEKEIAVSWLKQKNIALSNIAPIDLLDTSSGIEMVMDELTRIEYGVFA